MGNIVDYIHWRGDLPLTQSPFNEVDNLVLAYFSYINLDGIREVTGPEGIALPELADIFFSMHSEEELKADKSFLRMAPYMMKDMAVSRRFSKCMIRNYVNEVVTEQALQFSAVEISLEDGSIYVAFRGTDDTVVGWKEDFNLSNGIVPAEEKAAGYLNMAGRDFAGCIRVGGHSKGGNLAVYAAVKCDVAVQKKIIEVYDNDGPGFTQDFLEEEGIKIMESRIKRIIPECSVIGMLLNHVKDPVIISSTQKGILQHDGFSWEVMGPSFLTVKELNSKAVLFNSTLHKWIDDMDMKQRDQLINDLFSVIEATGVQTLSQVQDGGLKSVSAMVKQVEKLAPESKEIVAELIRSLFAHWMDFLKLPQKLPALDKIPFLP
ncbi:MAG: DUF2974 domain-containing protein [Eubacteriales bacterium]|nr:DUF2974 domain-containing protein [Eubacteriales bacterium]